ncbi:MAG: DUF1492 domain-containing protein [Lachnospiraceae bacterium]|nr:DUF1492 domain-containing protein [Lachnospiraceae bacterium]
MNAKQYLKQAYRLNEVIIDKQERLNDLKEMLQSTGAIDYSKDRVQTSQSPDAPFTKQLMNAMQLEEELKKDIERLTLLKIEINNAIEKVPDVDCSLVLSKRYILMKTWEQIAEEMNYSLTQLHRIHNEGLELFVVPKSGYEMVWNGT